MCGICGVLGTVDKQLLSTMMDVMSNRGPDDKGTFIDDNVMLANVRLAIIDIPGGKQPISNEDKSITVVYNGEIYNFKEIRADLEKKGHRFSTNSDTEVIVRAYEEYGPDCVKLFNGMFAYAIYDCPKKKLVIARDRCGIKPLFYSRIGNDFVFSSDVKSILLHPGFKRKPDPNSMHQFLNLRYIPGSNTLFSGIFRIPPGNYAEISMNEMVLKEYWRLSASKREVSEQQAADEIRRILQDSVERHMISDIPVGIFLSGGVDSSTILSLASRVSDKKLRTFSMGFGEPDDELNDAREVADHFGTDHKEFIIEKSVLVDFPEIIWHMGTPKRNVYPYYIYKTASRHVKVALGGLGGDELFGGYIFRYKYLKDLLHKRENLNQKIKETTRKARKAVKEQLANLPPEDHWKIEENRKSSYLDDDSWSYTLVNSADRAYGLEYLRQFIYSESLSKKGLDEINSAFKKHMGRKGDIIENCLRTDFLVKMTNDFLVVDDGTSMANSLEIRTPFLDNDIVDYAFSLPVDFKIRNNSGKRILLRAMKDALPESVFRKKKQGFATNTFSVYKQEMKDMAEQFLLNGSLLKNNYIKENYIKSILNSKPDEKRTPQYNMLWNMLALELWHRIFLESGDIRTPPTI